ncbi:MAG: hypothetical protein K2Y39_01625 [Candidatus Obscuribacterales bacterium]|nr:hypothetical protein [Candidatus Obscuribacterales bacterium]
MKHLLPRLAAIFALSALVSGLPASGQYGTTQTQSSGGGTSNMLKAGVEHSETVQPLESELRPGQRFDPNAAILGTPVDDWICIPPWFAGTFYVDRSLVVDFIDYRTQTHLAPNKLEKIYRTFHYGHQLDSTGRVWHLNRCPYRNSIQSEGSIQYNLIRQSKFLHSGNDSVVETATGPALVVSKETGVIARSTTIETFGRFEPFGQGIRKTTSIKGFNFAGMPEDLIVRVEQAYRLEPFSPDATTADSFAAFMAKRQAQREARKQMQQQGAPQMQGAQQMQGAPQQGYPAQSVPAQGLSN